DRIISAGEESGEKFWQLPLHEGYQDTLKSDVADMKNSPGHAGTITAALFIKEHIEMNNWVHLDIAGPCLSDKETPIGPKGGTGFGVGTLVNYLMNQ
ncbi:MAG TPA: leucyl aminopeptidase, partial [Armatimonadota bacterium]|nr:leucyl aminopeptidase [Armatimonadota bacterium]